MDGSAFGVEAEFKGLDSCNGPICETPEPDDEGHRGKRDGVLFEKYDTLARSTESDIVFDTSDDCPDRATLAAVAHMPVYDAEGRVSNSAPFTIPRLLPSHINDN